MRPPRYLVVARTGDGKIAFDWEQTPDDPGEERATLEIEARHRVETRHEWIARVAALVAQVEAWGRELGWQTRQIDKKLDDFYIGAHRVPALLMQEETFRVLLEPVGRTAPGAEGIVDLYLLPAYDDIASFYHYGGEWNVHYYFPGVPATANIRETAGVPLSKETLQRVLEEMRAHAA